MFEAIVEIFLIGTGAFFRWIFVGRELKFKTFLKERSSYWTDLFWGIIVWVFIGILVYFLFKKFQ